MNTLPELLELERIIAAGGESLRASEVCRARAGEHEFPVHAVTIGSDAPDVPVVGFFGGIHGLERIGTQVVLAFLGSLVSRLRWDRLLQEQLSTVRLVFMPLVNPGGMWLRTRSNPSGVDLMRNAPVEAEAGVPFLLGGQRISPRLPWYRGPKGAPMEVESRAVCRVVEKELLRSDFSLALDCHSGFGMRDRIWFPYARTAAPIRHLPEVHALKDLFDQAYPYHDYVFEPQSRQYLAHGDLWDYLVLRAAATSTFLPLTLEMGSWIWVRKNPRQLFSRQGIFNPLIEHRRSRVLRRHLVWLDFVARAAASCTRWLPVGVEREQHRAEALALWYGGAPAAAAREERTREPGPAAVRGE